MVELTASTPCADLLPKEVGAAKLEEIDLGQLSSVAPYKGKEAALSKALKDTSGVAFPGPNETHVEGATRIIWFGREMALLTGAEPDARLVKYAAVTDQTDAWTCATLSGPAAEDVLARLAPIDLRAAHFPPGATARTLVNHMTGSITRIDAQQFLILVFRSMAHTLVEELTEAMEAVAARG
ncbi:MAG: sarcosine oxidase subunit gamma [Pseudomonadota bacterium]